MSPNRDGSRSICVLGSRSAVRGLHLVRIVSWNINGIRAAIKKGFVSWLEREAPDVVCLQEVKATQDQVADAHLEEIAALGYSVAWHAAERKGYSGVATLCKKAPLFVTRGLAFEAGEGRILITEHGEFTLYNIYFPNGRQREDGPDPERLAFKMDFYAALLKVVEEEKDEGKRLLISGDWNTAHTEIDLARPRENVGTTGFLPEEREALSAYFERGFVDTFRHFHPASGYEGLDPAERDYTWWSYRAGSRERNIGWRIDYHIVSEELMPQVTASTARPEVVGSDHCPIEIELAL